MGHRSLASYTPWSETIDARGRRGREFPTPVRRKPPPFPPGAVGLAKASPYSAKNSGSHLRDDDWGGGRGANVRLAREGIKNASG